MKAMKLSFRLFVTLTVAFIGIGNMNAQFDAGTDLVSNYIWRGTKFGTGPAVQPYVEYSAGNFAIGSWGSFGITDNEAAEADLYVSYGFDFGLSVGVTDYYYPGTSYFDYSTATGAHGFEVNLGYEIGDFSIGANYMINQAGGAGTAGGDMYFELGYAIEDVSLFVGAGNGWHTVEANAGDPDIFTVCNVGMTYSKELAITETFSLPLSGSVILNPQTQQFYVVVGVSF